MTRELEKIMAAKIREYQRQGKSADWIKGWKRGFYAAGRSTK